MTYQEIIRKAIPAILETGEFIRKERLVFQSDHITYKGKNDLVSYVDKTAEVKLVEKLSKVIVGCGFIAEEGSNLSPNNNFTWIIDPLDGTTNFIHNFPPYAISVGLMHEQQLVGGIVYEITRDELFSGWQGGGAWLNGKRIYVSTAATLSESLLSTGFPYYNFEKLQQYLAILNDLMQHTHGLRRIGSAATDLAYVACGRFEGFFEYNLKPWDVSAGALLVKEAGGQISDFKGGSDYIFGGEIIAAGPVYSEFLSIIQNHW